MPLKRWLYPANWEQISDETRRAAGDRCEWCKAKNHHPHPVTGSRVVLTVHHLGIDKPDGTPGDPADKMDCRPENLVALCQRCHLKAERNLRFWKRVNGQLPLWPELEVPDDP